MAINQFVARNGIISLSDNLISGSLFIIGNEVITGSSTALGGYTGSLFGTASVSLSPISVTGSTIYSTNPATSNINTTSSVFMGLNAGANASTAYQSNFFGQQAGFNAYSSSNSNFFGFSAGNGATYATASNFFGQYAGEYAASASYSNFFGFQAGYTSNATGSVGPNNIIIGTNISLSSSYANGINIGGIIFGSGSYKTINGQPLTGSANGFVGINQPNPQYSLDLSGSFRLTGQIITTGSVLSIVTGSGGGNLGKVSITGSNNAGIITLTTGTTPYASASIVTTTYSTAYPTGSSVIITAANSASAKLDSTYSAYVSSSAANFSIISGVVGLSASAVYVWNYISIGY